jgi:3-oxoacyl-[acyl-carrier protein] reductase
MKNTVAIITGASQGIGRSTTLRLAKDFSSLVLAARNDDALKEVAKAVDQAGVQVLPLPLDLREPAADTTLVDETLKRFGRIDALVNIAGAVPQIDLLEMTDAQWDDGMALKLHGARRITIHAWDALKESKGSVVSPRAIPPRLPNQVTRRWQSLTPQSLPWLEPSPSEVSRMAYKSTACSQALS